MRPALRRVRLSASSSLASVARNGTTGSLLQRGGEARNMSVLLKRFGSQQEVKNFTLVRPRTHAGMVVVHTHG